MVSIGSPWRVIRTIIHLAVTGTAATDLVKAGAVALAVLLAVLLIRGLEPGSAGSRATYPAVVFALVILTTKPWSLSPMMVRTFLWATVSTTVPGSSASLEDHGLNRRHLQSTRPS